MRLRWKLLLRRYRCIPAFCKICGRDVHDFIAPDWAWHMIRPFIKYGDVLCYDCFCDLCEKARICSVWHLLGEK